MTNTIGSTASATQRSGAAPPAPGVVEIRPQDGPQVEFLATEADIAIYGGAAGGGKTYALLIEAVRNFNVFGFGAVVFRRTYPQIANQGGLWDESVNLYSNFQQSKPTPSALKWEWEKYNTRITFKHLQHEASKEEFQGAQIPLICFDELTHFTESQFFYMLSRNRSTCGVVPYMRATCNPDANSWVKRFLAPWLDKEFIFPATKANPEGERRNALSGELVYFSRLAGQFLWHTQEDYDFELKTKAPEERIMKSLTFVKASVYDNKILLRTNPQYLATLKALTLVEQERFLFGNWDIVETGNMFKEEWLPPTPKTHLPARFRRIVRFWDLASSKPSEIEKHKSDPDYTAGALIGWGYDGIYYLIDVAYARDTPRGITELIQKTAEADIEQYGRNCEIWIEEEPGSSGQYVTHHFKSEVLRGYYCEGFKSTGSKVARAKPFSTECQRNAQGNGSGGVTMIAGRWNQMFLSQATAFPNPEAHDDLVDAASGAYNVLNAPPEELLYKPQFRTSSGWRQ